MNYEYELTLEVLHELEKIGIDVSNYRVSNNNIQIHCPFAQISGHSDYYDRKPSFGFKVTKNGFKYNCFTCHRSGNSLVDLFNELTKYNLIPRKYDVFELQNKILKVLFENYNVNDIKLKSKVEPLIGVPDYTNVDFIGYNLSRGVDVKILKSLNVRYNKKDRSIIFPVYNISNKYLGYIKHNRYSNPKYKNYFDTKNFLFLENKIINIPCKGIIVEGVYDAIVTYSHLVKANLLYDYSVVAILGSRPNDYQFSLLSEYFSSLILYGDNDDAGIQSENYIYRKLRYKIPNIWRMRYAGGDPAEVNFNDFINNLKNVRPFGAIF